MGLGKILLAGAAVAIIVTGVLIYLKIEPFVQLPQLLQNFNIQSIIEFVMMRWSQILTAVGGFLAIAIPIYKWYQARQTAINNATIALEAQQTQMRNDVQNSQQITQLKSQINLLQGKIDSYQSDPALTEANQIVSTQAQKINNLENSLQGANMQIQNLMEKLANTPVKVVEVVK
jgi:uncharacterized protein HemX